MYKKFYFKDDHNRTLRVAIDERSDSVTLDIYNEAGYVIALPRAEKPGNANGMEFRGLEDLKKLAERCPLFAKK